MTTLDTKLTLAEIAATANGAVRVLEHYGLDYCCGGKQTLDAACAAKGLAPEPVLAEIEAARSSGDATRDWTVAPLDEMARYIVATHHEYLKLELPALGKRVDKVLAVHGAKDAETLNHLASVFGALRAELELHLHKEETILFPFLEQYGRAERDGQPLPPVPFGTIANPIVVMEREHDGAGDALGALRQITSNYAYPAYACSTVRALWDGLQAMEADLHVHIHLENNILFPRAIALEQH